MSEPPVKKSRVQTKVECMSKRLAQIKEMLTSFLLDDLVWLVMDYLDTMPAGTLVQTWSVEDYSELRLPELFAVTGDTLCLLEERRARLFTSSWMLQKSWPHPLFCYWKYADRTEVFLSYGKSVSVLSQEGKNLRTWTSSSGTRYPRVSAATDSAMFHISADNGIMALSREDGRLLSFIRPAGDTVTRSIAADEQQRLWVIDGVNGFCAFDCQSLSKVRTLPCQSACDTEVVAVDSNYLFLLKSDAIDVADKETGSVLKTWAVPRSKDFASVRSVVLCNGALFVLIADTVYKFV